MIYIGRKQIVILDFYAIIRAAKCLKTIPLTMAKWS